MWALLSRRWRDALRLIHPLAVVPFCVLALPWYLLCALRNPEFLATFLLSQNIERYLTPVFRHTQPLWFYEPVLALGLVPWTAFLCLTVRDGVRAWHAKRLQASVGLFFACWVVFPVLFFSFSQSKLPGYVLPALPPLALLLARSIMRAREEQDRLARWAIAGVGATYVVLSFSLGYWLKRLPPGSGFLIEQRVLLWAGVTASLGILVAALGMLGRLQAGFLLVAILTASLVEGVHLRVLPQLDAYLSPRRAASLVLQEQHHAGPAQAYRLRRSWHYALDFYLGRALEEWTPRVGSGLVVTSAVGVKDLEQRGVRFQLLHQVSGDAVLLYVESNTSSSLPN
jgi:4-amino-4-deoxy-L-arabinose transferase-like glycosyltransferase